MRKALLPAVSVIDDGQRIVFFSAEINMIFSLDKISHDINIIGKIPEEDETKAGLISEIIRWNDQYVFIPFNAESIWLSNDDFTVWNKIEIDNPETKKKFFKGFIAGDDLFLLKNAYRYSLHIDLKTNTIKKLDVNPDDFFWTGEMIGNKIYFTSCNSKRFYCYDVVDYSKMVVRELPLESFNSLKLYDDVWYLAPQSGNKIIIIRGEKYEIVDIGFTLSTLDIFEFNHRLYIPAIQENSSIIINPNDCSIDKWDISGQFIYSRELSNNLHCLIDLSANCYLFNKISQEMTVYKLEIEREEINKIMKNISVENGDIMNEKEAFGIEQYIMAVIRK